MATLCLLSDDGATAARWNIGRGPISVGRDQSADLAIEDPALSGCHFLILRQGSAFFLADLQSRNGTWVDGQKASFVTRLHHNDCIFAGRTLLVFSEHDHPDAIEVYPSETTVAVALAEAAAISPPAR